MAKSYVDGFLKSFFPKADALFIGKLFKLHVIALPELLSTLSSPPPHPQNQSPKSLHLAFICFGYCMPQGPTERKMTVSCVDVPHGRAPQLIVLPFAFIGHI